MTIDVLANEPAHLGHLLIQMRQDGFDRGLDFGDAHAGGQPVRFLGPHRVERIEPAHQRL